MIWPTRLRGFSDANGSWKIICISRRSGRSSRRERPVMSSPPNRTEPSSRLGQLQDRPAQRRLAAARLAHQPERLALAQREADVVHRLHPGDLAVDHDSRLDREVLDEVGRPRGADRPCSRGHRPPPGGRSALDPAQLPLRLGLEPAAVEVRAAFQTRLERRAARAHFVELVRAARAEAAARRRGQQRRRRARRSAAAGAGRGWSSRVSEPSRPHV